MCRKYGIECTDTWYDHQSLPIGENGDLEVRVIWDMTIYTDEAVKHNRHGITLVHKHTQKWTLAVPAHRNIIQHPITGENRYIKNSNNIYDNKLYFSFIKL